MGGFGRWDRWFYRAVFLGAVWIAEVSFSGVGWAVFKPAMTAFDSDFIANVVANAACRAYSDAEHNRQDFQYGGSVISSEEVFIGDTNDAPWKKRPFRGKLREREDTWGAVHARDNSVVVSFHGSYWLVDWLQDAKMKGTKLDQKKFGLDLSGVIHQGFSEIVDVLFDDLSKALKVFDTGDSASSRKELIFTGHSLGGALAVLSAARWAGKNDFLANKVKIITFSAPRVGDKDFADSLYGKISRENVVNFACETDAVPRVPFSLWKMTGYVPLGLQISVLPFEHLHGKARCGVEYMRVGGVDARVHVLGRVYEPIKPILTALVGGISTYVAGGAAEVVAAGALAVGMTSFSLDLGMLRPFLKWGGKLSHEMPSKKVIRIAWADTRSRYDTYCLEGGLEFDSLGSAPVFERDPISRVIANLF